MVRFLGAVVASCALVLGSVAYAQDGQPGDGPPGAVAPPNFPMRIPADPRVEQRSYSFAPTGEAIEYTLYVSSKVNPDVPAPLIVALHGYGGDSNFIVRDRLVDLAEEGGYVVVGPMGYNATGWYGSPVIVIGGGPVEPTNLRELSELDVLNVAAIATSEFNIDPNRVYVMGHSMGGAGALYLGHRFSDRWAAVAAIAPAAFMMQPNQRELLAPVKNAELPVMITQGSDDQVVPASATRSWPEAMEDLGVEYEYLEFEGADHGTVIGQGMPDIFRFFAEHERTPPPAPMPPGGPAAPR